MMHKPGKPSDPTLMGVGDSGVEAFCEDATTAQVIGASKAACLRHDLDPTPMGRQVGQSPIVAAVDP